MRKRLNPVLLTVAALLVVLLCAKPTVSQEGDGPGGHMEEVKPDMKLPMNLNLMVNVEQNAPYVNNPAGGYPAPQAWPAPQMGRAGGKAGGGFYKLQEELEEFHPGLKEFMSSFEEFQPDLAEFVANLMEIGPSITEFLQNRNFQELQPILEEFMSSLMEFAPSIREFRSSFMEFQSNLAEFQSSLKDMEPSKDSMSGERFGKPWVRRPPFFMYPYGEFWNPYYSEKSRDGKADNPDPNHPRGPTTANPAELETTTPAGPTSRSPQDYTYICTRGCNSEIPTGFYWSCDACQEYFMCSDGVEVKFTCAADLLYNPLEQQCDMRDRVDCSERIDIGLPESLLTTEMTPPEE